MKQQKAEATIEKLLKINSDRSAESQQAPTWQLFKIFSVNSDLRLGWSLVCSSPGSSRGQSPSQSSGGRHLSRLGTGGFRRRPSGSLQPVAGEGEVSSGSIEETSASLEEMSSMTKRNAENSQAGE